MSVPNNIVREEPGLGEWNILHAYRGSIAHNMYVPSSDPDSIDDKDTMGICVPPKDYFLGLQNYGSRGTREIMRDEWDIVIYEVRKVVSLLQKGNPNVLSLLWVRDNMYLNLTDAGRLLIDNRSMFATRQVYHSFNGYAYGQLKRMEQFERHGHMGAKRKELITRYGYDTKNAAHLIRLLRMGIEFMLEGELYVFREDAPQLMEIKRGKWTLEQVKSESDRLFKASEEAYLKSALPPKPNKDDVNELCVSVVETAWASR